MILIVVRNRNLLFLLRTIILIVMNNLLKWAIGLAALGVSVYVVGKAWKKSQSNRTAK